MGGGRRSPPGETKWSSRDEIVPAEIPRVRRKAAESSVGGRNPIWRRLGRPVERESSGLSLSQTDQQGLT